MVITDIKDFSGIILLKKVIFDDDSFVVCTNDHKFLLKNYKYVEVKNIKKHNSIISVKFNVKEFNNYKIKKIEDLEGKYDCYDLIVEDNHNFGIITKDTKYKHNGLIIVHNCSMLAEDAIQGAVKDYLKQQKKNN